ncbi:hypothetical protein E3J79_02055 [Candidatus Dependentiae bacterium]|nr:MAG: hypothetical protein E3J79_02055 [Candidatus Dependentiae bacterium]
MSLIINNYKKDFPMRGNILRYALYTNAVILMLVLSGCAPWEWVKEKFGMGKKGEVTEMFEAPTIPSADRTVKPVQLRGQDDKVLVTKGGVPVITLKSFDEEFNRLLEENPQLTQMMQFIPDIKKNVLNGLVGQLVMDIYVSENKIDQKPEYRKDFERLLLSINRVLNRKYYTQDYRPARATDAQAKKVYEEKKDKIPGLVISHGGVRTVGIKFEKEDAAKEFYEKVKGKSKEFDTIAKEEGLSERIQDFKLINELSVGIDNALRSKIISLTKFPTVVLVKGSDKVFWVVNAISKEEKQYRPFDEVKEFLKDDIDREAEMKVIEEAVERDKKKFGIIIDEGVVKIHLEPEVPEEDASKVTKQNIPKPKEQQAKKKTDKPATKVV